MRRQVLAVLVTLAILRGISLLGSWGIGQAEDCPEAQQPVVCRVAYDTAYVLTLVGY